MIDKLKNLTQKEKIRYGIAGVLLILCVGLAIYYFAANSYETTDPTSDSEEISESVADAESKEDSNSSLQGTVAAKGEFDGEKGTIEGSDSSEKNSGELGKITTITVDGEKTTLTATPEPTKKPVEESKSIAKPEATKKPESTQQPESTPAPTPAKCGVCGSTEHINHPIVSTPEPTPERTPEATPTPEVQVPEVSHYHGNGTDNGVCPACGLSYSPAIDISEPSGADDLSDIFG